MESSHIREVPIVVFDTEATGLSPPSHVVEVGAVKLLGDRMVDTFASLVKPPVHIPDRVVRIHGIDDSMVKHASSFKSVMEKFAEFIQGSVLVAHNAPFDLKVLSINLQRNGFPLWSNPVLDTCQISRRHFPEISLHSLVYLASLEESL